MAKYYIAVTYDVCEHENLYIDMIEHELDGAENMDQEVKEIAKMDVAPLVKVYESNTSDFKEYWLYKEYTFKEYECSCGK